MKKLSMQWRLTLTVAALVTVTCIVLNILISHSVLNGIDTLEAYTIQIDPSDSGMASVQIDPKLIIPELTEQIQKTRTDFYLQSILSTTLIILVSSFITYFLAGRTLAPLRNLSEQITKVQARNLSVPLEVPESGDEVARLTSSFNEMLKRLDESFTVQKQFAANAAHELRTPLAVIQTNLEVSMKKGFQDVQECMVILSMIQEQANRLSHLVEVLLDMTSLQTIQRTERISLFALTEEVLCDLEPIASKNNITLLQQDGDCAVTGSYILLYRVVYNLVENAVKYNRPSGTVTVSVCHKDNTAILTVRDTGIGIAEENQEKIFDAFYRVDKSRSRAMGGAGLGLALVRAILEQHGGNVHVEESTPEGTTIELELPADTNS